MSGQTVSPAQGAVWSIYITRVNAILLQQRRDFLGGVPPGKLTLEPPTAEHVQFVQEAMDLAARDARQAVINQVLAPVVRAIDGIDNSRRTKKIEEVKAAYKELERVYKELHAMKEHAALLAQPAASPETT